MHHIAHFIFLVQSNYEWTILVYVYIVRNYSAFCVSEICHDTYTGRIWKQIKSVIKFGIFLTQTTKAFYNEFRTFTNKYYGYSTECSVQFYSLCSPYAFIVSYTEFHLLWSWKKVIKRTWRWVNDDRIFFWVEKWLPPLSQTGTTRNLWFQWFQLTERKTRERDREQTDRCQIQLIKKKCENQEHPLEVLERKCVLLLIIRQN